MINLELVDKRDLDRLLYSSSINRAIQTVNHVEATNSFLDQQWLTKIRNPVIFDVGSYIGDVACKYATLFPGATVYAFEPTSASFRELKQKADHYANIHAFNLALSDSDGPKKFFLNKFSPTNSLLRPSLNARSTWGENLLDTKNVISVEAQTVDSFCLTRGISRIDILKLDVQGAELLVLNGARNMLSNGSIHLVYAEIIFAETYQRQVSFAELLQFMEKFDFKLFNLYNQKYLERQIIQADIIFVRR